jgi:hypothetical protein
MHRMEVIMISTKLLTILAVCAFMHMTECSAGGEDRRDSGAIETGVLRSKLLPHPGSV